MRPRDHVALHGLFSVLIFSTTMMLVPFPAWSQEDSTATGLSRKFNPAIGVNGLFLATYSDLDHSDEGEDGHSHGEAFQTGIHIQEIELGLSAVVDPYLQAQVTLAMHGVDEFEIEEAYARTRNLPLGLGFLAGKTYLPFGKHNRLHAHSFSFVDGPWIHAALFGQEGLNDMGGQLSYLAPLSWFSEVSVAAFFPGHESPFITDEPEDLAYLANWRNLWDLTPATTFELGLSWTGAWTKEEALDRLLAPLGDAQHHGEEDEHGDHGESGMLHFIGTDLTWKHVSARHRSWDISIEYLLGLRETDEGATVQYGGITGYGRFQVSRRWWVQARGDLMGLPMKGAEHEPGEEEHGEEDHRLEDGDVPWRLSGLVALVLSEYTAIRLQYDYIDRIIEDAENRVMLQLNITFGAHPRHSY